MSQGVRYSHSRLNTYENCPLQFKYRYIDKIETDIDGIEAFMGSRVHDTLEHLYNERLKGNLPTLDEILERYEDLWNAAYHKHVRIVKKPRTPESYRDEGKICLIDYYTRHQPFDQEETLALEKEVEITTRHNYKLRGFIDRLSKVGDKIIVHDYKTSSWLPSQNKVDQDRQLGLYQMGIQQEMPETKNIELRWHYLKHNKILTSYRTQEQLHKMETDIGARIEEIEMATMFHAKKSQLCPWCAYNEMCPTFKIPR